MALTTIRGQQLRDATVSRAKIDASFESDISTIQSNITSIFNTMSTDAERIAAINAVNAAWQGANSDLQTLITNMVNAAEVGTGLNTDGSFTLPTGQNYMTGATSLKAALGLLDAALATEAATRTTDIATVAANLQTVIDSGATTTTAAIAAEATARTAADALLQTAIDSEASTRAAAVTDLQSQISNEVTARGNLDTALSTSLAAEAQARTTADSNEATARAQADTTLQSNIDAEALARTNADAIHTASIAGEVTDRIAAVSAEATAREAADTALDGRVSTLEAATANILTYAKTVKRETPSGAIDGTNMVFSLANMPVIDTEDVYYNGQLLDKGADADYTISGKDITLTFAPDGVDRVRVSYFR